MRLRYARLIPIVFAMVVTPIAARADARLSPSHCVFHQTGSQLEGNCGMLFERKLNPPMTLSPALTVTSGTWQSDRRPTSAWSGKLILSGYDDDHKPVTVPFSIELESYPTERASYENDLTGWARVANVSASSGALTFDVDSSREVAPNSLDEKIVRRASAILSTEAAWKKGTDDRVCPPDATVWSIYCAMEKATIEVTGAFNHRRPSLQLVREIVDERSAGRNYEHRLKDYNNDVRTHLSDVQSLFTEALAHMHDWHWLLTHNFA
jgi:hypothetical protein